MVSLDCETTTAGDATLVRVTLESDAPTHVRVENCLDGPVWPPRRRGRPAAGWDEDGFEGVVDGRLALGYATSAAPADPPARVAEERPPTHEDSPTPTSLVREFGDGTPPRGALTSGPAETGAAGSAESIETTGQPGNAGEDPPAAVTAWLDTVERRLDDASGLAAATSLDDATEAVTRAGGPDDVRELSDQLGTDREALHLVATRCEELADRAETVEIPVETLARLA